MQQRNKTITIMKALAIICMVAGHSYTKSPIEDFVGLFHMPVFFICSGYCFKDKYLIDVKKFILRKIKTIWLPTFKWIIALVLLHNVLLYFGIIGGDGIGGSSVIEYYGLKEILKYSLMAMTLHADAPIFAGIWFLKMLLIASVIGFFIIKYINGKYFYFALSALLLMSLFCLVLKLDNMPIIRQGHLPFLSSFFFLVGYEFKRKNIFTALDRYSSILVVMMSLALLLSGYFLWLSSMVSLRALYLMPFCITAIMGTVLIYRLSRNLLQFAPPYILKYLNFVGNNTYAILMMHILSFKVVSLFIVLIYGLNLSALADFPTIHYMTEKGWWIVYLFIAVNVPLLAQIMYNKICRVWKK